MNLELSDEQLTLRDTLRRFLADAAPIAGFVRPMLDDPAGTTDDVWLGLAAMGTTGLLVSEDHGGAGATMTEAGIVLEELGRALHPGPWQSSAVTSVRALTHLDRAGSEAEAAKLLGGIAEGSVVATVALHDGSVQADAPGVADGEVRVSGVVPAVPDAAAADVVLIPLAAPGSTALVGLDASAPGATVTPLRGADGSRKHAALALEAAPARPLGRLSPEALAALGDDVVVASAADALGAAQAALDLAVDYAKVRVQFGAPIGSFQAVAHLCVDMLETVELARSGVLHGLWAADAAEPGERHLAALRCRAFAGRLAGVGETVIQVLGGIGFTWEHDAHLYLRRLLSWSALGESPDRALVELGSQLVHSVRQAKGRP